MSSKKVGRRMLLVMGWYAVLAGLATMVCALIVTSSPTVQANAAKEFPGIGGVILGAIFMGLFPLLVGQYLLDEAKWTVP